MRIIYIPKKVSAYEPIKYGYLYNWYAATDVRKITSSDDWVVPSALNFKTLLEYYEPSGTTISNSVGGKLKESGATWWDSPNTGADNSSGFNAKGAGIRDYSTGVFNSMGLTTGYINADDYYGDMLVSSLYNNSSLFSTTKAPYSSAGYKKTGYSIRLLYTGSGNPTSYTGNDGKVYRCVTIGGVTYMADNLAETLYRDGSTIHVVTDNATWAALTTGARCVYNNDESNK